MEYDVDVGVAVVDEVEVGVGVVDDAAAVLHLKHAAA